MDTMPTEPQSVDEYIAGFPAEVQVILEKIRMTIRKAAPDAKETLKYKIPTFTLKGNLVSFAGHKKHIGIYPAPQGTEEFQEALSAYRAAKSTVRLPLDKPIPYALISDLVKFRVKETLERAAAPGKQA